MQQTRNPDANLLQNVPLVEYFNLHKQCMMKMQIAH